MKTSVTSREIDLFGRLAALNHRPEISNTNRCRQRLKGAAVPVGRLGPALPDLCRSAYLALLFACACPAMTS